MCDIIQALLLQMLLPLYFSLLAIVRFVLRLVLLCRLVPLDVGNSRVDLALPEHGRTTFFSHSTMGTVAVPVFVFVETLQLYNLCLKR